MDTSARQYIIAQRLRLLTTLFAGLLILAALYSALWTPPKFLYSTERNAMGQLKVTWVAPDGPAWAAGLRPGDVILAGNAHRRAGNVAVRTGAHRHQVSFPSTAVTQSQLLMAGLGAGMLALASFVLIRGRGDPAVAPFWGMCMLAALALALFPAETHAEWWAIFIGTLALNLFAPTVLELTLAFPHTAAPRRKRLLRWLPALVWIPFYAACWWQPVALFSPVLMIGFALVTGYLLAAIIRILRAPLRARTPLQRAQLRFLALGLACGLGPFLLLTLLPLVLVRHPLVASDISILAFVLLPASVGLAIVRTEFLGITSLLHRRTLRVALNCALLAVLALVAGQAIHAGERWGYPDTVTGAIFVVLCALGFSPLRNVLAWRAERFFLRDAYDTAGTLLELSVNLSAAPAREINALVVTRLSKVLDLSFALLVTEQQQWYHCHPRSAVPDALADAVRAHARGMFTALTPTQTKVTPILRLPVLFLPIWNDTEIRAVLCLGPKRSGDQYTVQDRALLGSIGRHLAVLFHNHQLKAQLSEQILTLRTLATQVRTAADRERRRLAGVLHDDAIQLAGEIARTLSDLMVMPFMREYDELTHLSALAQLSADLVVQLRAVAAELQPPILLVGLPSALEALLHDAEQRSGCRTLLCVDPPAELWNLDAAITGVLYAIAREAIGNAVRHGGAHTITVTLTCDTHVSLQIADDGAGFAVQSVGAVVAGGHFGLVLMEERARELGGTLELTSAPGGGTTIAVTAPRPAATPMETRISAEEGVMASEQLVRAQKELVYEH